MPAINQLRQTLARALIAKLWLLAYVFAAQSASAQTASQVHIIYMGGNDCPPCVAWRREELPKLEQMPGFKQSQFSYVIKVIRSSVPSGFFLPKEVKPYKDKLALASNGITGSPQTAILVNGEVYDYYFGSRSAADIEAMIQSILQGKTYPFERCVKRKTTRVCEIVG
jgi:hypothetical protein